MGSLTGELKEFATKEGVDLVGITTVDNWEAPQGHRPIDYLKGAKSVVVLGMRMLDSVMDSERHRPMMHDAMMLDSMMDQLCYKVGRFLSGKGYLAYPMDDHFPMGMVNQGYRTTPWFEDFERTPAYEKHVSGEVSFKYAASRAGLGVYGRSSLIITPQFGPRVRFGLVLTDAPLEADQPPRMDFCTGCQVCMKLCPGKAITEKGHDRVKCFRSELETGVTALGVSFRFCPAYCWRKCPVGVLKERYRTPGKQQ